MKKYSLPKEFGEKWVDALRSGEYKQGCSYLGALYSDGITSIQKYCCLGVACKTVGIEDVELKTEFIKGKFQMPIELLGNRSDNDLVMQLTTMNDGEKGIKPAKSFPEISDWIVENVEFV